MPGQLTARRVAGDVYDVTAPESDKTFTDRCAWSALCQLADADKFERIDVLNEWRSDGELQRITYRPSKGVKFADMPRPSMARTEIVTDADKGGRTNASP